MNVDIRQREGRAQPLVVLPDAPIAHLGKSEDSLDKEAQKRRKEDTRKKVIVGAAILANIEKNPETRRGVVEVLNKAVTSPRDREFLKSCGLLS
ncbi:MAG: hypothetical protein ABSF23_18425 [Terracidiphilus sp.]